ncbi:MAG: insulinase family protein [Gemmatimonadota bacterium]|nr:insulinase family protein [Gemmatimonadota bacterium]
MTGPVRSGALIAVATLALCAPRATAQQFPTAAPPPAPLNPSRFPPLQEATLPNGLRLVLVEQHKQPVVSITLSMPAGAVYDPPGKEGTAEMAAGLLTKGAGTRSADQIAAAIEGVGGSLGAGAGPDFLTVRASSLTPDAALAFELLADAVQRPTFGEKEVELARTQTLSGLQFALSQPAQLASRFFAQGIYGPQGYGRLETPVTVRAITRDDLIAFQRARLRPSGALLVIAGDVTMAQSRDLAVKFLSAWSGSPPPSSVIPDPPARSTTELLLVHRPGSVQANVVAGNSSFLPTDPRWYATVVTNQLLGGGADARLFQILREQKSWTYGAYSHFDRNRGIGTFQATVEVRTDAADSALVEMLAQLRRVGIEAVTEGELNNAKGSLVGSFPLSIETADQVANTITRARLLGLPDDYVATYRARLAKVTPPEVSAAAQAVIRPGASLIVVVGDADKLYPKLKGIAPVRMVTVEGVPIAPADLERKAAKLEIDAARLVARRDSFTVLVQGKALGWQRDALEKTPEGFRYTEDAQIGGFVQQSTELSFSQALEMIRVVQSGKTQGQPTKIELSYAGGRAKGSATTATAQGPKSITVDTALSPGVLDDNALTAVLPALQWAPGAKWTIPVFQAGKGTIAQLTLSVVGEESVTVPAGTFESYRTEMAGGDQPITFWVSKSQPHRLVKLAFVGAPIEVVLVK